MRLGVEDKQTPQKPTTDSMEAYVSRHIKAVGTQNSDSHIRDLERMVMRLAKEIDHLRRIIIETDRV
jgi:hypothetical protein